MFLSYWNLIIPYQNHSFLKGFFQQGKFNFCEPDFGEIFQSMKRKNYYYVFDHAIFLVFLPSMHQETRAVEAGGQGVQQNAQYLAPLFLRKIFRFSPKNVGFLYSCTHPPNRLGRLANPVIHAIARLELEDGLRTGVLSGGYLYHLSWLHQAQDQLQTLLGAVWLSSGPQSDQTLACLILLISGVRIELA